MKKLLFTVTLLLIFCFTFPVSAQEVPEIISLEEAEKLGLKIPETAEGEVLYLGEAFPKQADRILAAFTMDPAIPELRNLNLLISNANFEASGVKAVGLTAASSSQKPFPISGSSVQAGASELKDLNFTEWGATAVFSYTMVLQEPAGFRFTFDDAEMTFVKQSGNEENQETEVLPEEKDDSAPQQGPVSVHPFASILHNEDLTKRPQDSSENNKEAADPETEALQDQTQEDDREYIRFAIAASGDMLGNAIIRTHSLTNDGNPIRLQRQLSNFTAMTIDLLHPNKAIILKMSKTEAEKACAGLHISDPSGIAPALASYINRGINRDYADAAEAISPSFFVGPLPDEDITIVILPYSKDIAVISFAGQKVSASMIISSKNINTNLDPDTVIASAAEVGVDASLLPLRIYEEEELKALIDTENAADWLPDHVRDWQKLGPLFRP